MLGIGLVMVGMRKIASSFSAAPGRASPMHDKCAISPRRETSVAACGKRPVSTYLAARKAGMRPSRAVSNPCALTIDLSVRGLAEQLGRHRLRAGEADMDRDRLSGDIAWLHARAEDRKRHVA